MLHLTVLGGLPAEVEKAIAPENVLKQQPAEEPSDMDVESSTSEIPGNGLEFDLQTLTCTIMELSYAEDIPAKEFRDRLVEGARKHFEKLCGEDPDSETDDLFREQHKGFLQSLDALFDLKPATDDGAPLALRFCARIRRSGQLAGA